MGWRESAKAVFRCFPRIIRRKLSKNSYAYPVDPAGTCSEKRKGSATRPRPGPVAEEEEAVVVAVDVPEVPLREATEMTGGFSDAQLIGQGSYAKVYRATARDGRAVVVKRLERPSSSDSDVVFFLKQLSAASRLKHDNLVRLLGYTVGGGAGDHLRLLVYEFAAAGTLHDVLHGNARGLPSEPPARALSWAHRARVALDAARGLEYLHETAATTHRDVRSTNVLLFDGYRAKIADYNMFSQAADMARLNRSTHTLGSFGYQAPEYAMTGQMTDKSDVYSFGVVLLELLTGRKPLDRTLPPGQRSLVNWATPILTEDRVQECIDPKLGDQYHPPGALKLGRIAVQCLQYDPAFRPSMGTVARVIHYAVVRDQQVVV